MRGRWRAWSSVDWPKRPVRGRRQPPRLVHQRGLGAEPPSRWRSPRRCRRGWTSTTCPRWAGRRRTAGASRGCGRSRRPRSARPAGPARAPAAPSRTVRTPTTRPSSTIRSSSGASVHTGMPRSTATASSWPMSDAPFVSSACRRTLAAAVRSATRAEIGEGCGGCGCSCDSDRASLVITARPRLWASPGCSFGSHGPERSPVPRHRLDAAADVVAALQVGVVVAVAGAGDEAHAQPLQERGHLGPGGEEGVAPLERRARARRRRPPSRSGPWRPRRSRGRPRPASAGCSGSRRCRRTCTSTRRSAPASRGPARSAPASAAASAATMPPPPDPAITKSTVVSHVVMSRPLAPPCCSLR